MREPTGLEKTVYGEAAHDVQMLFLNDSYLMSGRILNALATFKDSTSLTNQEAIAAWRTGMELEFPEVDWPEDYSVQPTAKSMEIRRILEDLKAKGVPAEQLEQLKEDLDKITIPE